MPANGFNQFANPTRNFGPNQGSPAPYQSIPANGLNFAGMQNAGAAAIHSQSQSGGQVVALAAVLLLAQANGVFQYDIDVNFADDTTAKTVRLRAVLVPGGAGNFTGEGPPQGTFGGFSQSVGSIDAAGQVGGSAAILYREESNGTIVEAAVAQLNQDSTGLQAKGLLFTGTNGTIIAPNDTVENAVVLWDQEIDTLTGQLSNGDSAFHAHGRCGWDSGAAASGFGVGNYAILVLELVSTETEEGADVITFGYCSMGLAEVG